MHEPLKSSVDWRAVTEVFVCGLSRLVPVASTARSSPMSTPFGWSEWMRRPWSSSEDLTECVYHAVQVSIWIHTCICTVLDVFGDIVVKFCNVLLYDSCQKQVMCVFRCCIVPWFKLQWGLCAWTCADDSRVSPWHFLSCSYHFIPWHSKWDFKEWHERVKYAQTFYCTKAAHWTHYKGLLTQVCFHNQVCGAFRNAGSTLRLINQINIYDCYKFWWHDNHLGIITILFRMYWFHNIHSRIP